MSFSGCATKVRKEGADECVLVGDLSKWEKLNLWKNIKPIERSALPNLVNALKIPTQHFLCCFSKKSWEIRTVCASPLGESFYQLNLGL